MRLLSWIFGTRANSTVVEKELAPLAFGQANSISSGSGFRFTRRGKVIWREGSFPMAAVGESNYQRAFAALCGKPTRGGYDLEITASIELEPTNPHDSNAVVVKIQKRVVGYLSREQAERVSTQMRMEELRTAKCSARIRGGWRTNQYDEGSFGVWLAIPTWGPIDFGTGRNQHDASGNAVRTKRKRTNRPEPADSGPLLGEWVAIVGAPSDGELAKLLASRGARIMAGVGKSTTMLVVAENRPFTPGLLGSAQYRKAEKRISEGSYLRIISQAELRQLL